MKHTVSFKKSLISGASILTLTAMALAPLPGHIPSLISQAYAGDGSGPKGQAGPSDQGQSGSGDNRGTIGGKGSGQGGPSSDSTSKGPRYGGGSLSNNPGGSRGKPSWSQDALPEDVDLGRLNVARAPAHVLEKSLTEALSTMDYSLYKLTSLTDVLDAIKSGTIDGKTFVRVDSPLENLALYKDILTDGKIGDGTKLPVTASNTELLLATFLGSASDKTIPITADTVTALNTILKLNLPTSISAATLAADAEKVRLEILEAHGE